MAIFMIEAEGDEIYIEAANQDAARVKFVHSFGDIPESMLTWTKLAALPEGAELSA